MTRKIRLGAFLPGGGQHIASWRHPDQPADGAVSLQFHIDLARQAERGLFDAYFLADGLAVTTTEGGAARVAGLEPLTLFAALSTQTTHLGFIATASTTYEEPYNTARKFASLDVISGGRAGWNVVTTATDGVRRRSTRRHGPRLLDGGGAYRPQVGHPPRTGERSGLRDHRTDLRTALGLTAPRRHGDAT